MLYDMYITIFTMPPKKVNKNFDTFTQMESEVETVLLCDASKTPHQIDIFSIPNYLNARAEDGHTSIKDGKIYVKCGNGNKCPNMIALEDILSKIKKRSKEVKKDFITEELMRKINRKSYENSGLMAYCPNKKCKGSEGITLDEKKGESTGMICPFEKCGKTWCTACRINPYHDGYTCSQAKRFKMLKNPSDSELYIIKTTQTCPKCNQAIEKSDGGCDHMKCICGTYFCYVCKEKLDSKYNKHVVFDKSKDTYICPKRLNEVKEGLAQQDIPSYHDSDDEINDLPLLSDDDSDDVEETDKKMLEYALKESNRIAAAVSAIDNKFGELKANHVGVTVETYNDKVIYNNSIIFERKKTDQKNIDQELNLDDVEIVVHSDDDLDILVHTDDEQETNKLDDINPKNIKIIESDSDEE